ncbi:MAG: hypothetical protein COV31_01520 [Candidatus Yanofskybacteria bacterium CG10_big_fil_rev_8_21_14_0_10_46_23]|uniref:Uncharacterized protein n=1 Tax=Candidatus Yanofskybacteria bacterium CG10_big_fil_rev_8_21_14_0_10_46_23 TaxID=1975098 RepID=A0A2H0R499_9BACT|nr:MAG: hypothetical protein COV31_01520 [Candidatus Yanofskybacteria bacterium CG10_big_fil_rev_8_21_14_0_10_46_23]
MFLFRDKNKKIIVSLVILFLVVSITSSIWPQQAVADCTSPGLIGGLSCGVGIANSAITAGVKYKLNEYIQSIAIGGEIAYWVINVFDKTVRVLDFQDATVVREIWKSVRDFVNMFFILILTIIAFGTIFNVKGYTIREGGLLTRFIVAAVLINFSLPITHLVIDFSNVFTHFFIRSIGDIAGQIGSNLGVNKIFGVQSLTDLGLTETKQVLNLSFIGIVNFVFVLVMVLTLIAATAFVIFRIFILWLLIIASPIAFAAAVLPSTKTLFDQWREKFIGWVFFLPIYLMFLLVSMILFQQRATISSGLISGTDETFVGLASFSFQSIFFYLLTIFILIWGIKASLNFGSYASSGASSVFNSIRSGTFAGAYKYSGVQTITEGVQQGVKAKAAQIAKEGLFGKIGGSDRADLRKAGVAQIFGDRDARGKELAKQAKEKEEIYKKQYEVGKISADRLKEITKNTDPRTAEGLGYRNLAARLGFNDAEVLTDTAQKLGGRSQAALGDYLKAVEESKYEGIKPEDVANIALAKGDFSFLTTTAGGVEARRSAVRNIKDNKKAAAKISSVAELEEVLKFVSPKDNKEYIKSMASATPKYVGELNRKIAKKKFDAERTKQLALPLASRNPAELDKLRRAYETAKISALNLAIQKTDEIADLPESVWGDPYGTPDEQEAYWHFRVAMFNKIARLKGDGDPRKTISGGTDNNSPRARFVQRLREKIEESGNPEHKTKILDELINDVEGAGATPITDLQTHGVIIGGALEKLDPKTGELEKSAPATSFDPLSAINNPTIAGNISYKNTVRNRNLINLRKGEA